MRFKAVIFDLGGVVFTAPQLSIAAYERDCGLETGFLTFVFAHGWPNNAFCRLERGELKLSEFFSLFEDECRNLAASNNKQCPSNLSAKALFEKIGGDIRIVPEMLRAIRILRKSGIKVCALTNNWIDDTKSAPTGEAKLHEHFDVVLESSKLGMRKPEPQIYVLACRQLATRPKDIVYLDDIGTNLKPAKAMGMTTILVRNARKALEELQDTVGINLELDISPKL